MSLRARLAPLPGAAEGWVRATVRAMSLRARLTLLAAVAVAAAVSLTSVAAYVTTRAQLYQEVDDSLVRRAQDMASSRSLGPDRIGGLGSELPGAAVYIIQLVATDGTSYRPVSQRLALPLTRTDLEVVVGAEDLALRDVTVGGERYRMVTVPGPVPSTALQVARPLTEVEDTLARLALVLGLFSAAGVLFSVTLGLAVARAGLAPVDRLTEAAEHVTRTQDLSVPIDVAGDDEVGRLASSFNTMLSALEESRARQRALVSDAGHELRTPLTSLRTNIELLARSDASPDRKLPEADRAKLMTDLTAQMEELSILVGDLVALARGEEVDEVDEEVDLAEVVDRAVRRAERRAPGLHFEVDTAPWTLVGQPGALGRAVTNLLDNAAKWSPPGGRVEVRMHGGELTVRDHGPGIAEEDLPRVFDRFYRAPAARHLPGSGLGLAIVRQAAESHGGTVAAERAPGGGTIIRLHLPTQHD